MIVYVTFVCILYVARDVGAEHDKRVVITSVHANADNDALMD